MAGCGFFESKRKQGLTRMLSKKPQLDFKERARCGFFETKREAKDMAGLTWFQRNHTKTTGLVSLKPQKNHRLGCGFKETKKESTTWLTLKESTEKPQAYFQSE